MNPQRGIVKVTDLLHWHCVRCDARLNMTYQRWSPGDLPVFATTLQDARKTCPPCESDSEYVQPIEVQVDWAMGEAVLRIMQEQARGHRLT